MADGTATLQRADGRRHDTRGARQCSGMTGGKRLGEHPPADKVGPLTARQYEYQHEQATMGALEMLARQERRCVYCEWHDDFVVEVGQSSARYHFHQVKSKSLSQGPWTFHEIFGVQPPRPESTAKPAKKKVAVAKPLSVSGTPIFLRLLVHDQAFGINCGGFAFVTNTGVDPTVSKLVDAVAVAQTVADLPDAPRILFDQLVRGYVSATSPLVASADELFARLRRFAIAAEHGNLKQEAALNEICDRVFEYSEIDLKMAERKQIARQLVQLIRSKATDTSIKPPIDDDVLRSKKGVVVQEILGVLSLSHEGYKALLAGGTSKGLVKTLSRLDRYCRGAGLEQFTAEICSFKAKWDVWRTAQRHRLEDSDYVSIVTKAQEVLATSKPLAELIPLAKEVAASVSPSLPSGISLAGEEILGLVFSLAADAEPK